MRVFGTALWALLSHWRQHPVQFFSVLTGLWLATSLLTGVLALNSQARDSYARASRLIGGEPQASLATAGGGSFPQQWFVDLRRPAGRSRRCSRAGCSSKDRTPPCS
ncbi:hypothetical protein P308_11835 [Pseudomonas piscis]|nr:hypothetical protein P308_11835 [Pseudomonas piscis]